MQPAVGDRPADAAHHPGRTVHGRDRRRARTPAPLLGAAGLAVAGLMLLPLGYLLRRSSQAGWDRIVETVTSERALGLLWRTSLLAVAVTAAAIVIAVPVAWVTVRTDLPLRRLWVVLTALPLAIPTYVGGFAYVSALGPRGVLQGWLEPFGVDALPEIYGFTGAWLVLTLFTYPYVLLTVRAAVRRLDPSLEEASRSLGQGRWTTFRRVVLPQLRPSMLAGSLLVTLYVLSDFGAVSVMRYDSFTQAIFLQYRASFDRSVAAILGMMLVAMTVFVLGGEAVVRRSTPYHRLHGGGARRSAQLPLGRWRWPVMGGLSLLVLAALALPVAVIVTWLIRGLQAGEPLRLTTTLVANSLTFSAIGAVACVVAAWPVAVLSVRRGGLFARLVEGGCWLGHSLPGVVVAISLVFFGAGIPWLYQSRWMLAFAYTVLFLPQALGAMRASLLQINPSLEEASRLLGRGSFTTFRRVVLPLARPGALAGGALVFLTCMKELPATRLLGPTGHPTLATQVWGATIDAFYGRAALPALMLILLSSIPMAFLVLRER